MASGVQGEVMKLVQKAQSDLAQAQEVALKANPMTADVPVFRRMQEIQKELGGMMLEVSKLRGL